MKDRIAIALPGCFFLFLLLFPSQTLEASKHGLILWLDTLLPTLLPFLIASQVILKTPLIEGIQKVFSPFFRRFFHCSESGTFCLLCGFLCGYPVGARLIALQIQEQRLTVEEGQYLLGFCSNVSPMFCISYGILYAIGSSTVLPYLFCIYGSAILFGFCTRPKMLPKVSIHSKKQTPAAENFVQLIDVCIIDSFMIMIRLCGYLILFSIFCAAILQILPERFLFMEPVICGFLEITGGLAKVAALPHGIFRSATGVAILSFGGLCCIFQTNSVICQSGLSCKKYLLQKFLITLLALFFFVLWHICLSSKFFIAASWCQLCTIFCDQFIITI